MTLEGLTDSWGLFVARIRQRSLVGALIDLGIALPPDPAGERNLMGSGLVVSSERDGWTTIWGRDPSVTAWAFRVGRKVRRASILVSPWMELGVQIELMLPTLRVGTIRLPSCLADPPPSGEERWPPPARLHRFFRTPGRVKQVVAALEQLDAAWSRSRLSGRSRDPGHFPGRVACVLGLPAFDWDLLEDLPVLLDASEREAQEAAADFDPEASVLAVRSLPVLSLEPPAGPAPEAVVMERKHGS